MKKILCVLSIFVIFGCYPTDEQSPRVSKAYFGKSSVIENPAPFHKAKNVIFMVGDGMGISQITAGIYSSKRKLNIEEFPIIGLHKSHAHDNLITDSAAGATAFATGKKTYNGAIGMTPDKKSAETILEQAEKRQMATGMVTTSTIVHATPASFIAHQPQRKMYEAIAADFMKTEIDLIIGGGKKYFDRREKDDRNLYEEMTANNYYVSDYFKEDLSDIKFDVKKNFAYFTADDDPLPVSKGRDYLFGASKVAAGFLKARAGDKGFLLVIEGAQIDWGGHANVSDYIVTEMLDFDRTIGAILDFAKKDGETLVVVTADHETGGYSINQGSTRDSLVTAFTSDYHTAEMIPVFAYGPGSEHFSGIYDNTEIFHKMRKALGF